MDVAVANEFGCGRNQRDTLLHFLDEALAATLEYRRIKLVGHLRIIRKLAADYADYAEIEIRGPSHCCSY
jgi:hypothetical protein